MAGFTNRELQSKEKIFKRFKSSGIWQYVICKSFLTLRRILTLSPSMVISLWIKFLPWDWWGTPILWLQSWQPSHYPGWGVLILKLYTTWNNNHKQHVTCTGSLTLHYLSSLKLSCVNQYRYTATVMAEDIQHHNSEESQLSTVTAVRSQIFNLCFIIQLTVP